MPDFPLNISVKEDHPNKEILIQSISENYRLSASEVNLLVEAIDYLASIITNDDLEVNGELTVNGEGFFNSIINVDGDVIIDEGTLTIRDSFNQGIIRLGSEQISAAVGLIRTNSAISAARFIANDAAGTSNITGNMLIQGNTTLNGSLNATETPTSPIGIPLGTFWRDESDNNIIKQVI